MTGAPYMLQLGGKWVDLTEVAPGNNRSSDRPTSELRYLGGKRSVQIGATVARSWDLSYEFETAQTVRWLQSAASGVLGDVYLLDAAAAQQNMLDPVTTTGIKGATSIAVETEAVAMPCLATAVTFSRLVRSGVTYNLGGWTSAVSGTSIMTYKVGAAATVTVNAPAGSGSRHWNTTFTPASDATVVFTMTADLVTTALRLTEGLVDTLGWLPGENTPCRVSVGDPSRVLRWMPGTTLPLSGYTLQLLEVG